MPEPVFALVVCPHPDDGEFGIAGTIARWVKEGKKVAYVMCSSGDKGTSDPEMKPEELARIREAEQLEAAKVLGVCDVVFLRYPDQGLEDTPELRKDLVRLIRLYKPSIVATSDPYRRYIWHRDHRMVGRAVLDAIFPYARDYHSYPEFIKEGLLPHRVKEVICWGPEASDVNFVSDITGTWDIKMKALKCHKSQVGHWIENPDREEFMKERHRKAAKREKFELAEAFHRVEIP